MEEKKISNESDTDKSICRIEFSNKKNFGFFIKLFKGDKYLNCLLTNKEIITKEMIDKKDILNIQFDHGKIKRQIQLNKEERYITDFTEINIDQILIEILEKDDIGEEYFEFPELKYINRFDKYKDEKIEIPNSSSDGKINYNQAKIEEIKNNEFIYSTKVEEDFCGCPIFKSDNKKVIGIVQK